MAQAGFNPIISAYPTNPTMAMETPIHIRENKRIISTIKPMIPSVIELMRYLLL